MSETGVIEIFFPKLPEDISEELRKYFMELEIVMADLLRPAHRDIINTIIGPTESDHGELTGLTDDDHTRYIDVDGTRVYTGYGDGFKDQDNMASNSDVATASQQSIKAYVDADVVFAANLVSNGNFASGETGWTFGNDWSVVDEKAKFEGWEATTASQLIQLLEGGVQNGVAGELLYVKFTLSGCDFADTDGQLEIRLGGAGVGKTLLNPTNGSYKLFIAGLDQNAAIRFYVLPSSPATSGDKDILYLDDVSVQRISFRED